MGMQFPLDWKAPAVFATRLGDEVGRQRVMSAEGQLLLVLHAPPAAGSAERCGRLFWRDADGGWRSRPLGDGVQSLKRHVGEFAERVESLEKQCLAADGAETYFRLLREIAPLHRTARHLHAVLQEARALVPEDRDLINLRDRAGEIERAFELLHGDAKHGLDFTVANLAEKQSQRTYEMAVSAHRLNLLAATFFPVATLSAIFGAVFAMMHAREDHGLDAVNTPALFWVAMAAGLVGGLLLGRLIARRPPAIELTAVANQRQLRRR
jgi:hypothetical protein